MPDSAIRACDTAAKRTLKISSLMELILGEHIADKLNEPIVSSMVVSAKKENKEGMEMGRGRIYNFQ